MSQNTMKSNKVILDGETLIDLTADTVTPETLAEGVTAHDKSGKRIVGALIDLTADTVTPETLVEGVTAHDKNGSRIVGILVPAVEAELQEKTITESGIYEPDEGYDGFSKVIVEVKSSKLTLFTPSIELQSVTGVLTITDNSNGAFVQGYDLYIGNELITSLASKEVTLTDYLEHTETIDIKVQAVGVNFNPSDYAVVEWKYVNVEGTPGLAYSLSSDGTYATCTGLGDAVKTDIEIAMFYDGVLVRVISSRAFMNNSSLTSVFIPDSVTTIESYVFSACSKLTSIEIPNSVVSIGGYAFSGCTSLADVVIPDRITRINYGVFSSCTSLTSIAIPDSVTSIGEEAFYGCSSLTSVVIPDSVTSIDQRAFEECTSLTSIEIPNSITSLSHYAFRGCSKLTSIEIPNSVTSIGQYSFQYCRGLTSVFIPNSVTSIGQYAFSSCTSLTSIEIPDSVASISKNTFLSCSNLKRVDLSNYTRVPTLGSSNAFDRTHSTLQIKIPASFYDDGTWANATNWSNIADKLVKEFTNEV